MVAHKPVKKSRKVRAPQITFTDREAVRLVTAEAAETGEPCGSVASRCIIRYYAITQSQSKN